MTSRRRKVVGAVAALALAGGIVLAGTVAAQAGNGLEIDTTPIEGSTSGVAITGTSSATYTTNDVSVFYGAPGTAFGSLTPLPGTATPVDIGGGVYEWSLPTTLPPGQYQIGISQAGTTDTDSELLDITLPTPVVSGPSSAFEGGVIDLSGSGYPGSTVAVNGPIDGDYVGPPFSCSGTVDSGGSWICLPEFNFDEELTPGETYTFQVTQSRAAVAPGDAPTPTSTTWDVSIIDLPDALRITAPGDGANVAWTPTITVTGEAPGTFPDVDLLIDPPISTDCTGLEVTTYREWACGAEFDVGTYTIQAQQGATLSPPVTFTVSYPQPAVTSTIPVNVYAGQTVNITGTTTYPGVTIEVTTSSPVGDCSIDTPMSYGTDWTCPLEVADDVSGDFDLYVSQYLGATEIGTWHGPLALHIDPYPITITSPASDTGIDWAPLTTIEGTSTNLGATVALFATDTVGSPDAILECQAVPVQSDGTWSCETDDLGPGVWGIYASQASVLASVSDVTIYIPAPVPDFDPYPVADVGYTHVYGSNTWPGGSVVVELLHQPYICSEDPDADPARWGCEIEFGELPPGVYAARASVSAGGLPARVRIFDIRVGEPAPGDLVVEAPDAGEGVIWDVDPTWFDVSGTTSSPERVYVYVGAAPDPMCSVVPVLGAWSCSSGSGDQTGTPLEVETGIAPEPGARTITVRQEGQASVVRSFDVLLPEAGVSGLPFSFGEYEDLSFYGQVLYPGAWTRVSFAYAFGGTPYGMSPVDCPPIGGGYWGCEIPHDLSPYYDYTVRFEHFLPGDPSVQGATAGPFPLDVTRIPTPTVDNDDPYVLPADNVAVFSGTTPGYYDGTVWANIKIFDDGETTTYLTCSDPGPFEYYDEDWGCTITVPPSLEPGIYPVTVFIEDVIDGDYFYSESVEFDLFVDLVPGTVPAPLECAFSPGGGFSVTSERPLSEFSLSSVDTDPEKPWGEPGLPGACNGSPGTPLPGGDLAFSWIGNCACAEPNLAPGVYEVYYTAEDVAANSGLSFEPHSYLFTIPVAPAIAAVASTTNSVVLSGSAEPGDAVRIQRVSNGATLCTTTATGAGTWACQFPKSSANAVRAIAIDPSGGMSAYSANRTIPVFVAPPLPTEAVPTTPSLVSWFLNFAGDLNDLKPGDTFTIQVSGMPAGTTIEVWMHSTPTLLGTAVGTGAPMSMDLTVPLGIENGDHELKMIAITPLGTHYFFSEDATVVGGADPAPVDDPTTPEDESLGETPGSGGNGGSGDRDDPAGPSALTGSIAPLGQIAANPIALAVAGGLAIALLFLVALPTELLNNALSSNTSRLGRAYGVVERAFERAQNWFIKVTGTRAVAAAILVTLVALIYGFVDPGFGFDIVSLRLVLSLGLAFFILSYGASWLTGLITRRAWGVANTIQLQPSIILFAILGVVIARLLDFSPGFLVGIAIGLELVAASKRVAARVVLVQFAVIVGLALTAWLVYSFFVPGPDFFGMLADDMLVAVTAEGLTGALVAIFPLRFLDGREIWDDSKPLWVGSFLLVAGAFALLVLPTAIQGTDVADFGTWLIVFAVFGALAIAVWLIFARAESRAEKAQREKVDA